MAMMATALALLISDWHIGSYDWPIAISVYGSLLAGCLLGRYFIGQNGQRQLSKSVVLKTAGATLMMSCLFFVVTNFAVWACGGWYPLGTAGLISCYLNAVPFFKYTLAGDVFFTAVVFGCYALSIALLHRKSKIIQLTAATK